MSKNHSGKSERIPVPPTIADWDRQVEKVTVNEPGKKPVEIAMNPAKIVREITSRAAILNTPPPYRQDWLDRNGLEVKYAHGRAELRFKK